MIAVGVSFDGGGYLNWRGSGFEEKSCKPDGCKLQAVLQEDNSGQPLSKGGKEGTFKLFPTIHLNEVTNFLPLYLNQCA